MRIGIPRGLYSCELGEFWEPYFAGLGHETIVSDETTADSVKAGAEVCDSGACLPIKAYHGAVRTLLEKKVDALFLPRVERLYRAGYTCPKVIGVNDMLKSSLSPHCRLIEPRIRKTRADGSVAAGLALGNTLAEIRAARGEALLGLHSPKSTPALSGERMRIALLGHPYLLGDSVLNLGVREKLQALGCTVLTGEPLGGELLSALCEVPEKQPFWITGEQNLGFIAYLSEQKSGVSGIVYLSSFGCGPDAFLLPFLRRAAEQENMSFLELYFDEHTGEAGLMTRLEAFVEMLRLKKEAVGC